MCRGADIANKKILASKEKNNIDLPQKEYICERISGRDSYIIIILFLFLSDVWKRSGMICYMTLQVPPTWILFAHKSVVCYITDQISPIT